MSDMKDRQLISVVMATYNGEKYLAEQIESILNQTHDNFELICIDDCSGDSTFDILTEFKKRFPGKISVYSNDKNLGSRKNFERACGYASGKYIAFSDQDDWWYPHKLEKLHKKIIQNQKLAFVYSNAQLVDKNLSIVKESVWDRDTKPFKGSDFYNVVYENMVMGCTILARASFVHETLPFPDKGLHQDWYMAMMAKGLNYEVDFVNEALIKYRQHEGNVVSRKKQFKKKSGYKERTLRRWFEVSLLDYSKFRDSKLRGILECKEAMLKNILEKRPFLAYRYFRAFYERLREVNAVNHKIKRSDFRLILRGVFFR
ncbi:MAG: glycosyltransferase [candidate division Zixibacteria bacterium]|nr:glycosyltransferase [candidate division Zixibacteria bacterium]